MSDRPVPDQALSSVADLAEAAEGLCHLLDRVFGGSVPLAHVRDGGKLSFEQLMPLNKRLKVIEDICEAGAGVADARDRFRHAVARSLHSEGFAMDHIALILGVTRQRVSAMLQHSGPAGRAAARGRAEPAPTGSRQELLQRSYEATMLRAARRGRLAGERERDVNRREHRQGELAGELDAHPPAWHRRAVEASQQPGAQLAAGGSHLDGSPSRSSVSREQVERTKDLRKRLGVIAGQLAATEEAIARTFDALAATRPQLASGFRGRASNARKGASRAREIERKYRT